MKVLISILITLSAMNVFAMTEETTVFCVRGSSKISCTGRVLSAFTELNCEPIPESAACHPAENDSSVVEGGKGKDVCVIESWCSEPNISSFGRVSCDAGTMSDLKEVDRGITMTASVGFFRHYVTQVCK